MRLALLCAGAAAAVPYDSYNDTGFWVVEGGWATADSKCPCINPWQGNHSVPTTGSWSGLQRDYGANYCRAWDEPMSWCQVALPPAYCASQFCYVDPNNCKNRPKTASSYFPNTNLHYSYATCGYTNDFNPSVALDAQLKTYTGEKAIRVSFPADSSSGFTLTTLPNGKRDGSIARFTARLLKDAGVEWTEVPISRQANFHHSDSRTACVHEVAVGGTDLCIGDFWQTAERVLLTSFSSMLYQDNFYLITNSVEFTDSFLDQLAIPFSPFTAQTWLMSLLALAYVSLGMHICEHNRGFDTGRHGRRDGATARTVRVRSDTEDHTTMTDGLASARRRSQSEGAFDDNHQEKRGQKSKQKREPTRQSSRRQSFVRSALAVAQAPVKRKTMKSFGKSIYLTMLGYVSAAPAHNARTGLGRVINIGAGLFVVVSMAMYTSQMTTNLVSRARGGGTVTTINGALEGDGDICLMASVAQSLVAKYPSLGSRYVSATDAADALTKMSAGGCAHAVLDEHSWANAQSGRLTPNLKVGNRNHCDKVKVGDPVYTLGNAMPVRENLQFPLSWKATSMAEAGIYEDEVFSAKRKFLTPSRCSSGDMDQRFAGSIGIGQMFGPIAICFLCTTFAIVATFVKTAIKELQGKLLPLWYATQDQRCPLVARAITMFALGYALCPVDLIPDFLPILGLVDDLLLLPLIITIAVRKIPRAVWVDAKRRAVEEPVELPKTWRAAIVVALIWITALMAIMSALIKNHAPSDSWPARNPEAMIASTAVPLLGLAVGLAMHGYQQEQDKAAEKEVQNEDEREYQATAVHHQSKSSIAVMATRSAENTTVPINTPVKLGRLGQELGTHTHAVLSPEERSMIASMRRQLV